VTYISSIYKKRSKRDSNNYRGILNTMSWLYGRILNGLIEKDLEEKKQSGFRTERSYIDNIFCLTQVIEKETERNQEIYVT